MAVIFNFSENRLLVEFYAKDSLLELHQIEITLGASTVASLPHTCE